MKIRIGYALALSGILAIFAIAADTGLEGTWVTDGVAAVEAAMKAGKSVNGLPEGTRIKFKVDVKKNKVSGTITQLNTDKEFDIMEGVLTGSTFAFKSVEVVAFTNNRGGGGNNSQPAPMSWKGELTDANTLTLSRVSDKGETIAVVYHRAKK